MAEAGTLLVLEWSSGQVRLYDPATGQTQVGRKVRDVADGRSGQRVVVALSRQTSFLRSTRLPDVPKPDMAKILALQVANLFPIEPTEAAVDFVPLDDKTPEGRLVVVGAVRTEVLRGILAEVTGAGFHVVSVLPAAMASLAVCKELGIDECAVVGMTPDGLTIDVVFQGGIRASRTVASHPDREETLVEIGRSFASAGLYPGPVVTVGKLELPEARASLADPLASLSKAGFDMSLEMPEAKAKRSARQVQRTKSSALLLWVAAIGAMAFVFDDRSQQLALVDKAEKKWKSKLELLRKEHAQALTRVTALRSQKEALNLVFNPKQPLGDVVTVFTNLTPNQLWLTGISLERGKRATLRGTALTSQAVTSYLSSLGKQTRMRDVKLVFANNALIETTPVVNFSISTHVVGNLPLPDEKSTGGKK